MQLMFDADSVVQAVPDPLHPDLPDHILVRLLRQVFYRRKITLDDYANCYDALGKKLNWPVIKTRAFHNNHRRNLASPNRLSIQLFLWTLFNVLDLHIKEFQLVLEDPETGEVRTFSNCVE